MAITLKRELRGRRNAPLPWEWSDIRDDAGEPIDFTAAEDVRMQVRLYPGAQGVPLISLPAAGAPLSEGLILGLGSVQGFIDEVTLALLPETSAWEPARFAFDALFDFAGVVPEVWVEGDLIVHPGVTDRLGALVTEAGVYVTTEAGAIVTTE